MTLSDDTTTASNHASWSYTIYRWIALILYLPFLTLVLLAPLLLRPENMPSGLGIGFGFIYLTYHTWRLIMTCTELHRKMDITTTSYAPRLSITSLTTSKHIHKILRYELSYLLLPYIGIITLFGTLAIAPLLRITDDLQLPLITIELVALAILFVLWAIYGILLKRKR